MNNLDPFDPAPFSNHSGHISNFGKEELSLEFEKMSHALLQGIGDLPAVSKRELAFRWVLATSNPLMLAARYTRFELLHRRKSGERAVMRNWAAPHRTPGQVPLSGCRLTGSLAWRQRHIRAKALSDHGADSRVQQLESDIQSSGTNRRNKTR